MFILSILILSFAVFYISRLAPGDPLTAFYGEMAEKMTPDERDWAIDKLGLNAPIYVQYIRWLKSALCGDFGISYQYKQDVLSVISSRTGNTLILGGTGFVLIFVFALILGVFCAYFEGRWFDKFFCKVGTLISCIPEFWLSLMLIFIFSVVFQILPSSGAYSIGSNGDITDRIRHLILPLSVVVISHLWYYAYLIRNKLLEEVRADYVLLAKSKGLSKRKIVFKHCMRNMIAPYLSIMAISVSHIMGGTYIIETVFSYPGLGTLSYESARYHDYNLLMVLSLLSGIVVIFFNMLSRIINERIDPRMRNAVEKVYE